MLLKHQNDLVRTKKAFFQSFDVTFVNKCLSDKKVAGCSWSSCRREQQRDRSETGFVASSCISPWAHGACYKFQRLSRRPELPFTRTTVIASAKMIPRNLCDKEQWEHDLGYVLLIRVMRPRRVWTWTTWSQKLVQGMTMHHRWLLPTPRILP